jgi:hypothetical protein
VSGELEHVTEDGLWKVRDSGLQVTAAKGAPGPAPDFALIGLPRPGGGVQLFASLTLTSGGFKRELEGYEKGPLGARLPVERITVQVEMKDFQQVLAEDYRGALRDLLDMWDRAARQQQSQRAEQEVRNALPPGV